MLVPRPDHAIAMSYFANDCIRKMKILAKKLEVSLGPDTADLSMRIGELNCAYFFSK